MSAHAQGTAGRSGEQYKTLTLSTTKNQDDESFEDELSSEDGSDEEDEENEMSVAKLLCETSVAELLYSSSSYHAIVKPVSVSLILPALSLANNPLVMVSVICCMIFVMVLCYKKRCMKFMIGYMIYWSLTMLGLWGGTVFKMAVDKYQLPIDVVSFVFTAFNFCIVGVLSIFWSFGIPSYITQCYLVATSVIMVWQWAHLDEWTTWTILFMLACYDLCAVLTPCGPLKALVNLMSKKDTPEMPGSLYELELPPEARRPGVPRNGTGNSNSAPSSLHSTDNAAAPSPPPAAVPLTDTRESQDGSYASATTITAGVPEVSNSDAPSVVRAAVMPLAIARVYNLPVIAMTTGRSFSVSKRREQSKGRVDTTYTLLSRADEEAEHQAASAPAIDIPENPTPRLLRTDVTVRLPPVGGTVERITRGRKQLYLERDRLGAPKRTLWVDRQGIVFAEMEGDGEQGGVGNSIKPGLGDFIFYSVLVAKGAMYSFATFAACMLVILAGLGGKLVLLSVYRNALPALPISIFMAIIFYLLTPLVIEPWIKNVMTHPMYV